jgi:hypothetical protein
MPITTMAMPNTTIAMPITTTIVPTTAVTTTPLVANEVLGGFKNN